MPEAPVEEFRLETKSVAGKNFNPRESEALDFIERMTTCTDEVQKRILSEILAQNANTEYLQNYGLNGRTDRETFKKLLPVVSYENIEPYIMRIANGDTSPILAAEPISEFLTSSGTSAGERKLMPTIEEEFERKSLLYSLLMPVMNQYVPDLDKGKGMYFLFVKAESKTPGGLPARPVLTSYYKSRWFKERPYDPCNIYTSPTESILCLDTYQGMYCQMLCGLLQRSEVVRVGAVFASGFLRAIRFLEEHWNELCHDIRTGCLSETIRDPLLRNTCGLFQPHPDLATSIEKECRKESWEGIIARVWPRTKYIDVIVTGTMAQYIPTLDFYSGGLPLVSTMYASSECYFGLNLNPLCHPSEVRYTIMPNMGYFEFLPVNRSFHCTVPTTEPDLPLELADLEVGHEYELIVTTFSGLYRYRVGDILRVTGYYNRAPQLEFVCRKNVVLSIDSDKTDEETLHKAIRKATTLHLEPLKARLVEYTSYAESSTIPGHYVLFWELRWDHLPSSASATPPTDSSDLFEACCYSVEESLDSVYRQNRKSRSIGALEIRVVKTGTFDQLMDYSISRGASINQYKTPRCVTAPAILQLLDSRVTHTYFSFKCPPSSSQWAAL